MQTDFHQSPIKVIQPQGYLTAANARDFQQQLTTAVLSPEHSLLLVDMEKVKFLDSVSLMTLVSALSLAQSLNRQFVLCSVLPSIRIIFELTQLNRVFKIFENRDSFAATYIPVSRQSFVKNG